MARPHGMKQANMGRPLFFDQFPQPGYQQGRVGKPQILIFNDGYIDTG